MIHPVSQDLTTVPHFQRLTGSAQRYQQVRPRHWYVTLPVTWFTPSLTSPVIGKVKA